MEQSEHIIHRAGRRSLGWQVGLLQYEEEAPHTPSAMRMPYREIILIWSLRRQLRMLLKENKPMMALCGMQKKMSSCGRRMWMDPKRKGCDIPNAAMKVLTHVEVE